MAVPSCPWWVRWWHRRMRKVDRLFMVPALQARAHSSMEAMGAFYVFTQEHGQEHWRCLCGHQERREVLASLHG